MNHSNETIKTPSIAILGGTFDPIHNGHILPANNVKQWLGVQQITLLPAHIPPHKKSTTVNAVHRANMVKQVCKVEQGFYCDTRELHRSSQSYTVDSLNEIKAESPNSQIFFIIGMDSLQTFMQWHNWQEILTLCHLVVNTRPNYQIDHLSAATQELLEKCRYKKTSLVATSYASHISSCSESTSCDKSLANTLDKTAGYILFPPATNYDISSTELREILSGNHDTPPELSSSLTRLLPEYVINYINQHQLYKK